MDLGLTNKVVWITGASGGIGRALATQFAEEGARVALQGQSSMKSLESWLSEQPWRDRALTLQADIESSQELAAATAAIRERWGRIDACIANAGVWPPEDLLLDRLPEARLRKTLGINLIGSLLTVRAFLETLRACGPSPDGDGASATFVGSTAGRFGERGHVDYAASKAGLIGAMRTLKNEIVLLDPYGRVNVVEPGWTVTHMARPALEEPGTVERVTRTMPLRQLGRAKDIARTVAWLSSPRAAGHVTGQVVTVAGGMEGRLLWEESEIDRADVLGRLERD